MGRVIPTTALILSIGLLTGCPAKDWIKRDDTYLSVEQYNTMTEVIRINDTLYRVKKGEELNQNKITQLFFNLQSYLNAEKNEQNTQIDSFKNSSDREANLLNTLSYVLILLDSDDKNKEALKILSDLDYSSINLEDKDLFNLAQILHELLDTNKSLQTDNSKLSKKVTQMKKENELVKEEVQYLNKQVNALKSIEESIHAREVGIELVE